MNVDIQVVELIISGSLEAMQKFYELFNGHLVHVYFYAAPSTPPLPPTTPNTHNFEK